MIERGLIIARLVERTGRNSSNISRIISGKTPLTADNQVMLAAALDCTVAALHENIGDPITKPEARTSVQRGTPGFNSAPGFQGRFLAMLEICLMRLGLEKPEDVLPFLMSGDYSRFPPLVAAQLRDMIVRK